MSDEIRDALSKIFSADSAIYQQRGFQRRIGFGSRPALIHIDLANAWTRPGYAFTCDGMDVIIPAVQRLNEAARAKNVPIVYTTTAEDPEPLRVGLLDTYRRGRWQARRRAP